MREIECLIAVAAADVDVLAKYGELLCQVAVKLRQVVEAGGGIDALVAPHLKGMGATAGNPQIQTVRLAGNCFADFHQFVDESRIAAVHAAVHLDHALGHLRFYRVPVRGLLKERKEIGGAANKVEIAAVEDLQLKLDPYGEP